MRDGPVIDLSQVVLVNKFGERLAPIVPYGVRCGCSSGDQLGEMREEIVAAALEKFGGKGGGPIGSVGLERVGEDGVGGRVAEGFEEGFAYGLEVGGDGLLGEGIEDPAFGSYGGPLDLLAGATGDEDERYAGAGGGRKGVVLGVSMGGGGVPVLGLAVDYRDGDDGVAVGQLGLGESGGVGGDGDFEDLEAGGGLSDGNVGAAVGPAAAEGDVDAQAELAAFGLGVADVVEHIGADEGFVDEAFGGVI